MTRRLIIERAGPAVSVQDLGRPGALGQGVSRGGAVDRQSFLDGAALLSQPPMAALEMAGLGGTFVFTGETRFALTGTAMPASLDGAPLEWNAMHTAKPQQKLIVGAAAKGVYGYLHLGGGIATEDELGGRGYHKIAGLGGPCTSGDELPLGPDAAPDTPPQRLAPPAPSTSAIRVMAGPQTALFKEETRTVFEEATFTRSPRANRQGVGLEYDGTPFSTGGQLSLVSDFIAEGDIQMTGDGMPYVLLAECQTMGGYPRIGTVLPADLPRIAQAMPGDTLRFRFVTLEEAEAAWQSDDAYLRSRKGQLQQRTRDPREMADLLSYELIDRPPDEVTGR